jgi:hypothetical protein
VDILFDFFAYLAVMVIMVISKSYQADVMLSLLSLIPILFVKIVYTRSNNEKMGTQLLKLRKTYYEEHSIRSTLVGITIGSIFIIALNYLLNDGHRIMLPLLLLIVFGFLERSYTERFLQKGLMDNGICTGSHLIEWDRIKSYKWSIPRKKKDSISLKIGYYKFYSYQVAYLSVLDDQKEEVDEVFKKRTSSAS